MRKRPSEEKERALSALRRTGDRGKITSGRWTFPFILAAIAAASCCFASPTLAQQPPDQQLTASISGTIADKDGNAIAGAQVTLTRDDQSPKQQTLSDDDGKFSFANVAPGPFQLTIMANVFAAQTYSGTLASGQNYIVPQFALTLATVMTVVRVEPTAVVAEKQIKAQEQQRVLGIVPNFYVSYVPDAAPLDPKQKFELSWKNAVDPVTFALIGAIAGLQQADNDFSGYGQGAQGYANRYGASYADFATGTLFGSVILPAILKQDPRYFYKGTGTKRSRIMYAVANAVICKGDNGHWQPSYSSILGNLASGGIANLYYPPQNRNGVGLTFEVTAVGVAATAADNLLQEFVIPKLTPKSHRHGPADPATP
ncbi:MAG: carboxypeptidase-like regulatory domain-containing protein [Candidatus Acidiferrales bacterium]